VTCAAKPSPSVGPTAFCPDGLSGFTLWSFWSLRLADDSSVRIPHATERRYLPSFS
jgi:hypothetical protein